MGVTWNLREHLALGRYAIKWLAIAGPVAFAIGSACALFLWSLDWATRTFGAHPGLLYGLPVAGVVIVLAYRWLGKGVEGGNNLIMDEIHEPEPGREGGGGGVPLKMAPLILMATVVTHLFGGSAGREGTAVQMGGALASTWAKALRLPIGDVKKLLMVGIAAGFAGVFGTPLAATVFAMEVLAFGRLSYEALFPCLVAGIVADYGCSVWGIHHTQYHIEVSKVAFEWGMAGKVMVAAVGFGLVSVLFAKMVHGLGAVWKRLMPIEVLRPVLGAGVIICLVWVLGTRDYLGLGVVAPQGSVDGVSIVAAFTKGDMSGMAWFWKLLFTVVTLSCGFKGGEVTPLFFIGACLGNAFGRMMGAPLDLFAGLGFVAVFAGATNTPLACTLMAIELFGSGHVVYYAIACFVAYLLSGHNGIYPAQRVGVTKLWGDGTGEGKPLRELH